MTAVADAEALGQGPIEILVASVEVHMSNFVLQKALLAKHELLW